MSEDDIRQAVDGAVDGCPLPLDQEFELNCARYLRNDVGNAKRLMARHGKDLMFVREVGWYAWIGTHWSRDDGDRQAHLFAHQTAQAIWREVKVLELLEDAECDEEKKKALASNVSAHRKWAKQVGNSTRLRSMLAEAVPYLVRTIDELDCDPYLFCVQNGTLDMREPDPLREHRRDDRITRISPVIFDASASSAVFHSFLQRIIPDNDTQLFLQRYFGYSLTGAASEQVMLICHGEGANGKSTLCDLLTHIMGDYAVGIHFSSLLHDDRRRGADATPDIARLPGARFVLATEPELGARFSESTVKQLTGGDTVTARHLNRDFFEFKPQFKLTLAVNHKPTVRGQDDGIWRRVLLTPFTQKIPKEERDRALIDKLKAESSGVLNWLLDGARLWLERGLEIPSVVREAVDEYRAESDPVGSFIEACCRQEATAFESAKRLYDAYSTWCTENAVERINSNQFGRRLTDRGFKSFKQGVIMRRGLDLVDGVQTSSSAESFV